MVDNSRIRAIVDIEQVPGETIEQTVNKVTSQLSALGTVSNVRGFYLNDSDIDTIDKIVESKPKVVSNKPANVGEYKDTTKVFVPKRPVNEEHIYPWLINEDTLKEGLYDPLFIAPQDAILMSKIRDNNDIIATEIAYDLDTGNTKNAINSLLEYIAQETMAASLQARSLAMNYTDYSLNNGRK